MGWEGNSIILLHAEAERLFYMERKMSQDRGALECMVCLDNCGKFCVTLVGVRVSKESGRK